MKKPNRRLYYKTSTSEERYEMTMELQRMGIPINWVTLNELVNNNYAYDTYPVITWDPFDEKITFFKWVAGVDPDILISKSEFFSSFNDGRCVSVNENGNFKMIFK